MTSRPAWTYPRALTAALVAGLTVWACLLAWSPLLENPDYVVPLLAAALGVGLTGATCRWFGLPPLAVALAHVMVSGGLLLALTTGSPVPTPDIWLEFRALISDGVDSARTYTAPVPRDVPPVGPLFLVVGTGAAVMLDLVALSWRQVALGALVILALHLVPANLAVDVDWWLFALVAAGFLVLLHLDADDLVLRWGRRDLHEPPADVDGTIPTARAISTRTAASAVRIGALAIAGALMASAALTAVVPQSPVRPWTAGSGSGGQVSLTSPLVDMRRDLDRGADISLLTVEAERRPTYVRHAVLPEFDGREWSTGDRSAVALPQEGTELPLAGVDPLVRRTEREYVFAATDAFRSRWLPLMPLTSQVRAEGDWRWDQETSDVASFDTTLTTSGETWGVTGVELEYSSTLLEDSPSGVGEVPTMFSQLPDDLPNSVAQRAREVTAGEENRFAQALALQSWFRSEFDYSLDQVETVDNEALVEFLSPQGRVGYCEQFAAAMAVMARTLDIPSRVAVGFLEPRRTGVREWEFSSHDLHAWPELYFPGSGWVRFEPTPASRASGVPEYTEAPVDPEDEPSDAPSETAEPVAPSPSVAEPESAPSPSVEAVDEEDVAWRTLAAWLLGLLALSAVALTPHVVRQRRRASRLDGGDAEQLWSELRDSSLDMGLEWPGGRSPRATGTTVLQWLDDAEQPGARSTSTADHVERLVVAVEHQRFARPGGTPTTAGAEDVTACVEALGRGRSRMTRWRARWLPRSLVRRR